MAADFHRPFPEGVIAPENEQERLLSRMVEDRVHFLRLIFKEDIYYYYVLFVFFLVGLLFLNWFRKSRLGYQLRAIKDNEDVARSLGINVHWAKIKTYAIATAYVSVVGSFHACYIKAIEPEDTMSLDISILIALMAMLGGAGSLWGPIIGAGVLEGPA